MPGFSKEVTSSRKIVLPTFVRSITCSQGDGAAMERRVPGSVSRPASTYYFRRPISDHVAANGPEDIDERYNLYPIVLDGKGRPWEPAVAYIAHQLQLQPYPNMITYHGITEDLAYFLCFLEEKGIDYADFPENRQRRPTYRFKGHLTLKVRAGETAASTAKRRMGSVIGLYRYLKENALVSPRYPMWTERELRMSFKDARGTPLSKKVTSTDVSYKAPKSDDPFSGVINDGGRLFPLNRDEQTWLISALAHLKNTEMTLIHACMLMTGARIQTALTLRVRHFEHEILGPLSEVRISVGPGSGIDTKSDKRFTLFIPLILYDRLRTYAKSDRARSRRLRAPGGDSRDQYLFLSQQGAPYYECKAELERFDPSFDLHHRKRGQTVRVFIRDHVLPYIRMHDSQGFHYRMHDLRASYGMNMSDSLLQRVELGEISLSRAREILATRMGHASTETTDLYLDYRRNIAAVLAAVDDHERYLRHLIQIAWDGTIYGS